MYIDNKKVFIAGGTGMVGSSIAQYIVEHCPNTKVRASYFRTEPFILHERIEYVSGDITSLADCRRMAKGCDCAVMAAADTANSSTIHTNPASIIAGNLTMCTKMLEAFHNEGIKRVVYIGSATLYQDLEGAIREDMLDLNKEPAGGYFGFGWVVRFVEKLCEFWSKQGGMEMLIVRASNIFGPFARFDPVRSNFIPAIIRKAVDKMDPFEVWGTPNVVRDVIYSEDFANAILTMLNKDAIKFETFNIGSGISTTVKDVVDWSLKYGGHKPAKLVYNINKPVTMKFRLLDCAKARNMIGWEPQIVIEEGIKRTVEWWVKNKEWWKK